MLKSPMSTKLEKPEMLSVSRVVKRLSITCTGELGGRKKRLIQNLEIPLLTETAKNSRLYAPFVMSSVVRLL